MLRLLKISWLNVKNRALSMEFLIGMIAAFSYLMLWVFFVHPPKYGLLDYDFELGRFLYVLVLYAAASILRDDIRFNATKAMFTGIFSRTEIMLSKAVSLILWGIIFTFIVEVNNVVLSCILHNKIGFAGFMAFNHLELLVSYIVITFSMGSLMLLIVSIMFSEKKYILFFIVILSMINFYTSAITTAISVHPEAAQSFAGYMKTPFFNTMMLMQGQFNMQSVLINIAWAIVFYISTVLIIQKREIK